MIADKLLEKRLVFVQNQIIKTDPGTDKDLFDAGNRTQTPQKVQILTMVDDKVFAWFRRKALLTPAKAMLFLPYAGRMAEIGGRTADVVDISFKIRQLRQQRRLSYHGILAACRNAAPLMIGDRTEMAGTEAAAHMRNGKFDQHAI